MRDSSGRRRDVTRSSPIKLNTQGRALPDRTGQRALDAVLSAAADIRVDLDDALSDSITVRELWKHYRDHLISPNRAGATISPYDDAAKTFYTAFGGRRLFEVTTSTIQAFLQEVGHARGPSNMQTARNVGGDCPKIRSRRQCGCTAKMVGAADRRRARVYLQTVRRRLLERGVQMRDTQGRER
ncbi:hypothetical protein ACFWVM_00865 [Nocardia fluminea]|uniref:hypothetical protein n=1 Tax=Nocardia fluminea TaxID=134984 RepID=UPI003666888F